MNQFHNILFVSNGLGKDTQALQEAISLALANNARLNILIFCPSFPPSLEEHRNSYEAFLLEKMQQSIDSAKASLSLAKENTSFNLEIEWGDTPDIRIIQRVLRESYDLVIKAVENKEEAKGFEALDMSLLRKCPCTLFLHRPFKATENPHIAVAIDPKDKDISGHDLALDLLRLSQTLSKHYQGHLSVITCWSFIWEHYLRSSVFINASATDVDEMAMRESKKMYQTLLALLQEANIQEPTIHYMRGTPSEIIPDMVSEKQIDVLIMGTVARTGLAGFIIGNTAENILQKINCSLWALKPPGFISPVKAY
ncbi:universal stress protein family protein [Legionella birminghamensis]|uniref:Universal stress protein family n=1 Tax=Legionella birminghamensis TaxID=28083 RepID=A0A378IDH8_9GAMM|nr:universal stress protein [Legionella birminghamensis]KTC68799.1 universal stress protein family protein [Legionella birminghamensis]STX33259.1 universal stress protein family [Legionella birminghamensis]